MDNQKIIKTVEEHVHKGLIKESSGHGWFHIKRVRDMALKIGKDEGADLYIVELSALLHDVQDWKLHYSVTFKDERIVREEGTKILERYGVNGNEAETILNIAENVSFKGAGVPDPIISKEHDVVMDSDRLDAMGYIGIARCFNYGGHIGRKIYNPNIKPVMANDPTEYIKNQGTSINHFYEKLILLKDRMRTNLGKKIAEKRHQELVNYLEGFLREVNGEDLE